MTDEEEEEPINWWSTFHHLMAGEGHFRPSEILRLTVPQLLCMAHEKPPSGASSGLPAAERIDQIMARRRGEEDAWVSSSLIST